MAFITRSPRFLLHHLKEMESGIVPGNSVEPRAYSVFIRRARLWIDDPSLKGRVPCLLVTRIKTRREFANHLWYSAAGRGDDGLSVRERLDDRKSEAFI